MRVLIVKLSSFGDIVHAFPAVTDLAAARPGAEIDWLVEDGFASFVPLHPAIAAVHAVGLRRHRWPPGRWPTLVRRTRALRTVLRGRRYDLVVDLQGLIKSAVLARLAGAPVAGYDRDSAREPAAARLYARRTGIPRRLHAVERSRRLMAAAVGYPPPDRPPDYGLAVPSRDRLDIPLPDRYAIAVRATSWPTKHWPDDHWRALFDRVAASGPPLVLTWGTPEEEVRARGLAVASGHVSVLPRRLAGDDLAAFVGGAAYAVGVDSGIMHLAAGLGVPGVWLYGPTDAALTGPFGPGQVAVRSSDPRAPCGRRVCDRRPDGMCCMAAIMPETVAAAVQALPSRETRT